MIELSDDCIFISDAHYNNDNKELYNILKNDKSSMIILMGDIFDLLFGEIDKSISENKDLINLLNEISITKEIIYLEGNHDFNIGKIFPNIKVYPIKEQPLIVSYHSKTIALAHGDRNISYIYSLYTSCIRNRIILWFINFLNNISNNKILDLITKSKKDRDRCYKIENFENMIKNRLKRYKEKYIIEGHYHQDKKYNINKQTYINLPAFVCSKDIIKIKDLF